MSNGKQDEQQGEEARPQASTTNAPQSLERLTLRTIRYLCLVGESMLQYVEYRGDTGFPFNPKQAKHCADRAEHAAQYALEDTVSGPRFALEMLIGDIDWLAQFDLSELWSVASLELPGVADLSALRSDVETALAVARA
ncbi:hypothetical protein [Paraburkholderia sp. GAS32]|uniref:hypothetical protein n=1 Tax=Paraburkholderia sp. GAS32 TaxID=3035129 RepID=UPI003D1F0526